MVSLWRPTKVDGAASIAKVIIIWSSYLKSSRSNEMIEILTDIGTVVRDGLFCHIHYAGMPECDDSAMRVMLALSLT